MAEMKCPAGFKPEEFSCKCGCGKGLAQMEQSFLNRLEMLRTMYASTMIITSGFRCNNYNQKVGGESKSQHLLGKAVDVALAEGDKRYKLIACAMSLGFGGVGVDGSFVHLDNREGTKVMWLYPVLEKK